MTVPVTRKKREFVSEHLHIRDWKDIKPYFDRLLEEDIQSVEDLEVWMKKRSELESVTGEDYRWKYIIQSCDTNDEKKEAALNEFLEKVMPHWMQASNQLNQKISQSEFLNQLDTKRYGVYLRGLKNELELYREENIPLLTEADKLANEYGKTIGAMTVTHEDKTLTLQQAQKLLLSENRTLRKEIFEKIQERRLRDKDQLEELFDKLLHLRHQIALNAGFENFRDYMMRALNRFDYSVQDCENFHQAISKTIVPIMRKIHLERKEKLNFHSLKPYDLDVALDGDSPLQPFETGDELLNLSVRVLDAVNNYFGDCIRTMEVMNHLDLDSRVGKRPGGYNMPLPEIGVPFIFMNAAGTHQDVVTMLHEAGHAVHSFLSKDLTYNFDKEFGSEVAELASMSMELMSMDYWNIFYSDEKQLKRAKREQMERVLSILPWIAIVDKFQHWIYTNPTHSREARKNKWREILEEFSTGEIDWSSYENFLDYSWHKQLHIFEVPFYYIEYGIAQLGAVGVWKNFKEDSKKATSQYMKALSLGGTVTLPEMYQAAGVEFDFSEKRIRELAEFLEKEL